MTTPMPFTVERRLVAQSGQKIIVAGASTDQITIPDGTWHAILVMTTMTKARMSISGGGRRAWESLDVNISGTPGMWRTTFTIPSDGTVTVTVSTISDMPASDTGRIGSLLLIKANPVF